MSRGIEIEEDLFDQLLIVQSLLEHERRLKNIEQKMDLIIKEISMLEVIFEEKENKGNLLNKDSKGIIYIQRLYKILEVLDEDARDLERGL